MTTYQDYYNQYSSQIMEKMDIAFLMDLPEVHALGEAMRNLVKIKTHAPDFESNLEQVYNSLLQAIINEVREEAEKNYKADDDGLFSFLYIATKVAVIAAVSFFAPPLIEAAIPILGLAGSIGNSIATGVAVGLSDAGVQGLGMKLNLQDKFSASEVLESAVGGAVGAGVSDLTTLAKAGVVGMATAGTQGVEKALGLRDDFDPKAIGLQIATSIIASGIKNSLDNKVVPHLGEQETRIMATVANTAVNSVLSTIVNKTPLDLTNMAAQITGSISGQLAGESLQSKLSRNSKDTADDNTVSINKKVDATKTANKNPDYDPSKICPQNDSIYNQTLKYTSISMPTVNDALDALMKGDFQKLKEQAIKEAKANYTPLNNLNVNKKTGAINTYDGELAGINTANILARLANGSTGKPYSVLDSATPFEKALLYSLGITAGVTILPEAVATAVGTISTAFLTGAVNEVVLLQTLANPMFLQMASRLGILTGEVVSLSESNAVNVGETLPVPSLESYPENTIFHSVNTIEKADSVLGGIDVQFFKRENRFGEALYTAELPETTIAELKFSSQETQYTIRYNFNRDKAKILDLTDPKIREKWGYTGGEKTENMKLLGDKAKSLGYDVIRFKSERGEGANLAILDNFESLLQPQMIVPAKHVKNISPGTKLNVNKLKEESYEYETSSLRIHM